MSGCAGIPARVIAGAGLVLASPAILAAQAAAHPLVRPPDNMVVTISTLEHKMPAKARKEMMEGTTALERDDLPAAIGHFRRALAADPKLSEAHNDLAVAALRLNDFARAEENFGAAIAADPARPVYYYNLGIVYYRQRNFPAAELVMRQAVAHEAPPRSQTLWLLALSIAAQDQLSDEALHLFQRVQEEYPLAHICIAQLLEKEGDLAAARRQIEEYLSSPDNTYAGAARVLLVRYSGAQPLKH